NLNQPLADVVAHELGIATEAKELDGGAEKRCVVAADNRRIVGNVGSSPFAKMSNGAFDSPLRPLHGGSAPSCGLDYGLRTAEGDCEMKLRHVVALLEKGHGVLVGSAEAVDGLALVADRDDARGGHAAFLRDRDDLRQHGVVKRGQVLGLVYEDEGKALKDCGEAG